MDVFEKTLEKRNWKFAFLQESPIIGEKVFPMKKFLRLSQILNE
jgi:hypothetical protein